MTRSIRLVVGKTDARKLAELFALLAGRSGKASQASGTFRDLIGPIASALIGALIGSMATAVFIETYRAEDQLRKYILVDLYRPLRDDSARCLTTRETLASSLFRMSLILGLSRELLRDVERRPERLVSFVEQDGKSALGDLNKLGTEIDANRSAVARCVATIALRNEELATVLGKRKEFTNLTNEWIRETAPAPQLKMKKDSKTVEYLSEPAKLYGLLRSLEGATKGSAIQAQAAISRIRILLDELHEHVAHEMEYQVAMRQRDESFLHRAHLMFIEELGSRYSRGPIAALFH